MEQELEMKEEEVRIEDSINVGGKNKTPTFYTINEERAINKKSNEKHDEFPRLEKYKRQAVSVDPENFIEAMKEEIREHKTR
jgi:hypothetical protein